MADNISITAGSGTTVATDDCTTGHAQIVKLAYGADGDRTQVGADANGLDVDVVRLPALVAGTANIGDVDVLTVPAPLSTAGGGTEATALRVTLANDSTGLVSVDDNGGSLTVDSPGVPTALGQSTMVNSMRVALASDQTALPITDNAGSLTVDNAGAFATQDTTATATGDTALQAAAVATGDGTNLTVTGYGVASLLITGTFSATVTFEGSNDAGTTWTAVYATAIGGDISTTTTVPGQFLINCAGINLLRARVTWTSGTSVTVVGRATNATTSTQLVKLGTSTNEIGNVKNSGTFLVQAALNAGTNNIGDVDVLTLPALVAGTANIGDVDVLTVPVDPFGVNADAASATGSVSAKLRFIAATGIPITSIVMPAPLGAAGAASIAKTEDVASANADVGIPAMAVRKAAPANTSDTDGDYEMLQISAGRLWTSSTIDAALPAGANAIGKLAANSGVDIGDVDVTSLAGGTIAHDAVDSGNPVKVGSRAAALAASVTLVAVADRTDNVSDLDGAQIVRPGAQLGDLISAVLTNTDGASTAFGGSYAATANVRNYISAMSLANTSATTVTVDFRDGTGGAVIWTAIVPAGGGYNMAFNPPLRQPTTNTALAIDGSAAATTITASVCGFKSKA